VSGAAGCAGAHDPFPKIAAAVTVRSNRMIAPGVYELVAERSVAGADLAGSRASLVPAPIIPAPAPGQFFMLRARPSGVLLGRPISVYVSDESTITFLILKKGRGSAELCELRAGDSLDVVGPIGNRFLTPAELRAGADSAAAKAASASLPEHPRVAVIGGGIGVAPVAGFSLSLQEKSFDFYASFRSAPYGLDLAAPRAAKLVVTTEDGSAGVKGMLPAVFDPANYDLVYACGPTPMLRYIKDACAGAGASRGQDSAAAGRGPLAFVSLEEHMACGAGACLGCTVRTVSGNRRCCVDGPVFNAAEVTL
jgi:NAD(P)H-flavin reductase